MGIMTLLGAGSPSQAFNPLSLNPALFLSPAGPYYSDLGTTLVTTDGSAVRRWADISGNGRHADAPSDAARPTLRVSGGRTWLDFDGVDDCLQTGSSFAVAAVAAAARHSRGTSFPTLLGTASTPPDSGAELSLRLLSATVWGHNNLDDLASSSDYWINNANTTATSDNSDETITPNLRATYTQQWRFGGMWRSDRSWPGRVYAFMLFQSALSTANRTRCHDWLRGVMP